MKRLNNGIIALSEKPYMGADEAARYLNYKRSYIYNLVNKGELSAFKPSGKTKGKLYFEKIELDRYIGRGEKCQ